jgi:hypothetical protein
MQKSSYNYFLVLVSGILLISLFLTDCKRSENPIKFPKGTFPDTLRNLSDINSPYDDYNLALYQLTAESPIVFSSNRKSSGGQFDLVQASISYIFDQTKGTFQFTAKMTYDPFLDKLINKAVTSGDDFGPFRIFSSVDGYEYLILSSVNAQGNLDLFYLKNFPVNNNNLPDISGPFPVTLLNTGSNDAYLSLNLKQDSAYFTSDRAGNFDIYIQTRPADMDLSTWFNKDFTASAKADSVNSTADDKCPMVFKNIMVFASNRPGGLGGYDLYYSVFRNGNWSSPVNLGPRINSSSDEFRPVIGYGPDFTNNYLMFSSNRPGGKGGFDLYFTGYEFPVK